MDKHDMPICFTADQYKRMEEIAKQKGMLNVSQLVEELLDEAQ